MSVIHEANPSVEDLREALSDRGVVGRDDLDGLVDFAAIGLTLLWWRNTPIEGWHAGGESALSDGEMFRISTHTTWKLGEHLRTWLADYGSARYPTWPQQIDFSQTPPSIAESGALLAVLADRPGGSLLA